MTAMKGSASFSISLRMTRIWPAFQASQEPCPVRTSEEGEAVDSTPFFFFFFLVGLGSELRASLAKQVLYHLSHTSLFCYGCFGDRVS
jgi:hypothetical protein